VAGGGSVKSTRVRIFYPADPVGVVPGGIDTFLRGLIKFAPEDIDFSLVGMTTDVRQRPVGCWTKCGAGAREFDFFPVVSVANSGTRGRVPLSVRFTVALWREQAKLRPEFDVFDFHRAEPSLLFAGDSRPKNFYFHQDPQILRLAASDNLWKRLPAAYESIERRAMATMSSAWCVRESGVQTLRERYPEKAGQINFIPTWVDAQVFHPVDEGARKALRERIAREHGVDNAAQWLVSVGRLDTQKDPVLMLAAFARLCAQGRQVAWLVVGDGVLRAELQRRVQEAGLGAKVHFLGLRPPAEIADILRAADVYALSSAYEGMPMALLEGMGSGLPAAVTDVGEVRRVVKTGVNGAVAQDRSDEGFAIALAEVLDHAQAWRGDPVLAAVAPFQPATVLAPAYDTYRDRASPFVARRLAAWAVHATDSPERRRHAVVGVPIDLLDRQGVSRQLVAWGKAHESRYMCFANVHSAILASHDERHRLALLGADMVAPDGAPIAWSLRVKGYRQQQRVDGPGMMWALCDAARETAAKVGLYGSTDATLQALQAELKQAFPGLQVVYAYSPPFRELSEQEDQAVCDAIRDAGVELLFVGLGCPKQEDWMARHRGRVPAVMLGVGAAFEFHAGTVSRAPRWMREHGLEWLYRLGSQPGRLWRRYLFTNSVFLARSAQEAARSATNRPRRNRS
jgi:exopolysaccharide biosynthesis WecB/TagA/CpsF family protein